MRVSFCLLADLSLNVGLSFRFGLPCLHLREEKTGGLPMRKLTAMSSADPSWCGVKALIAPVCPLIFSPPQAGPSVWQQLTVRLPVTAGG
ncbi:hypothetical protein RRG08_007317 [Elysia crispata]|uniref:Secreted protein n=1 Tax=Elysia crispata TaxID=231223 RepID=A0AAE1DB31_9GAST|nr:hypothetical protein RRG08_007317 [Elysia crispata]